MASRTKRKYEQISHLEQPAHRPRAIRRTARRHILPIEAAVPKEVAHLLCHPLPAGRKTDVATTENLTSHHKPFTQEWDKAHHSSIAAGCTLTAMAHENPPSHQAPMDPSLAAFAQARPQPLAPIPTVGAIPPEQLMPWFHHFQIDPSRAAQTLPDRACTVINNDSHSSLYRNPLNDLPANLNAAFPLPTPSLNRYSLPSVASVKFQEGPPPPSARTPSQLSEQSSILNHGNLVRQINTYRNAGFSWARILGILSKAGHDLHLTVEGVKRIYKENQENDDYHYTGSVGKQKEVVEPGDFAIGGVEAAVAGCFVYLRE
ncbi:MAG: hypothetical protein Q9173_001315 [Seirophora scorigena]